MDLLTRTQRTILDASGCANKGRDNSDYAVKGSGKCGARRYKCEMCDNWSDLGRCHHGTRCDYFHKGPDDNLPWWPHEAKLDFWMASQVEDVNPEEEEAPPSA